MFNELTRWRLRVSRRVAADAFPRRTPNSSPSSAPPPRYPILVRQVPALRWIAIRQLASTRFLKLVKAPRVRQGVIFSIFSGSVNQDQGDADKQQWPPLGWRARVGQDDRLEASATVKGLRDPLLPIAGWGFRPSAGTSCARRTDPCGDGGVGDRTLSSIGRAEPSGDSNSRLDRDIDRQPLSSQRTSR